MQNSQGNVQVLLDVIEDVKPFAALAVKLVSATVQGVRRRVWTYHSVLSRTTFTAGSLVGGRGICSDNQYGQSNESLEGHFTRWVRDKG